MTQQIENIKIVRTSLLRLVEDLTTEQLNEIPQGFNNNIIWNLAHLTATQQRICYLRSGLQPIVQEKYIEPFKPDTKPEGFIDSSEVEVLKNLMLSTIDELLSDYKKDFFTSYTPILTRYGVELTNINDAINFLLYHEGLHAGYIMAMKHVVKK